MAVSASVVVQLRSHPKPPSLQSCLLAFERASRDDAVRSLSWIVSAISSAAKGIAAQLRTAGLDGALGAVGQINVQGEAQQALDVIANDLPMAAATRFCSTRWTVLRIWMSVVRLAPSFQFTKLQPALKPACNTGVVRSPPVMFCTGLQRYWC